ncbi:hypothetical protein SLE2022_089190 [Rubroshorea leprosula]
MTPISDFSLLFFTCIGIFAVFWYTWTYFKSKKGTSKLPPGPPGLPFLGNLPFLEPELHTYFAALARKYGPVVKLQLGTKIGILITSPAMAREVLKDQDITFANRDMPVVAKPVSYGGSNILWNPYGPEWRMLRKVTVVKMLSKTRLWTLFTRFGAGMSGKPWLISTVESGQRLILGTNCF